MSLREYYGKRRFRKTPEPKGEEKAGKKIEELHFVVHRHDATRLHFDLRLEMDGVLKSWAVPKEPTLDTRIKRLAIMVEDHPLDYRTFEGTIPEGNYGAGEVTIWDEGFYHSSETKDEKENEKKLREGLAKGGLHFLMFGSKLKGKFSLVKVKSEKDNEWLLIKHDDEYSEPKKDSERGNRKAPMPHDIKPMLASTVEIPFNDADWVFEIKWDGYRAVAEIERDHLKLYSRNGISFVKKYKGVAEALRKIEHEVVLDGEIIAPEKSGKHSFQSLQNFEKKAVPLQYVIFDILYKDGRDLRELALLERKKILKEIMPRSSVLVFSDFVEEKGVDFFEMIKKLELEGMVAKDAKSSYQEGIRSSSWLKIKNQNIEDVIICGFTEPKGSRQKFGALVLGLYKSGKLRFVGHTGNGFDEAGLKKIHNKLSTMATKDSPFDEKVKVNSPVTWVEPKLVCQVKFTEWTSEGHMRHPIFLGIREDKEGTEAKNETNLDKSVQKKVKFSNLEKIYWPKEEYTKGDVIKYYDEISAVMLPYLKDRPENLNRHPNGIDGNNFYQKNITSPLPKFIDTCDIWSDHNQKKIKYLMCQNKETLLYLANLGCIEINPWTSRKDSLDRPDYMIFDLDPGKNTFNDLIKVARTLHEVLVQACEDHYCKTSGKSGMHIVVPLGAKYDYETIRIFAEMLMKIVHRKLPDLTSMERKPEKRKGKIYLDFLQNRSGQTIAAPYSLRPWPGATVSTPLLWSEVKAGLDPSQFNIKNIAQRIREKGDLWKATREKQVDLLNSIKCLEGLSAYIK